MHSSVSRMSSIGNSSVSSVFAKHKGSLREVPAKEVGIFSAGEWGHRTSRVFLIVFDGR